MANSLSIQVDVDGPRNYIVSIVGALDTADIVASTAIVAGITSGSAVVTYATTTALVNGQTVTGAGIPVGATISSIQAGVGFTLNTPATATNAGANLTLGGAIVVDPALMGDRMNGLRPVGCDVDHIVYSIEPGLDVRLQWEATAPTPLQFLTGAGHVPDYEKIGGIRNNAGAGKTGRIILTTQGWAATTQLTFTITLQCVKK